MANPYSGEWQKINQIADAVNQLQSQIDALKEQVSELEDRLLEIPYETDEDGNDIYEGLRNSIYNQIHSVNAQINQAYQKKEELSAAAYSLASSYRQEALEYGRKASQSAGAAAQFQGLSKFRFGASTASAGAELAKQRTRHYEDHAAILNELAAAAELASQGGASAASGRGISDRGTFHNPGSTYKGAAAGGGTKDRVPEKLWSGKEGNSVKFSKDDMTGAALSALGLSGIPHVNGVPDFRAVSHGKVGIAVAGAGMVAAADAMLAKRLGTTGKEIAGYRKENGLEWRADGSGKYADLIPGSVSREYGGGGEAAEPTPMEALTAYMWAHNYGRSDYGTYSKDPEWQKLHREAFPELYQEASRTPGQISSQIADDELSSEEKVDWVSSVVPGIDRAEAGRIVRAMEDYSGQGYKTIHYDKEGVLPETRDILRVFDSGKAPVYQGTIYRGLSFHSKREINKLLRRSKGTWKEPGITSFSRSKDVAEEFAGPEWGMVMRCGNNKSGIPFRHMSMISGEDEILSPGGHRNSGWKINYDSIRIDRANRRVYVDIEEI